jgi:putative endonuclease
MAYFVYILYSPAFDRYYIGQTDDTVARLLRHNNGYERATAPYVPWISKCIIQKETRGEAMVLEKKIKNLNREKLLAFIEKYGQS